MELFFGLFTGSSAVFVVLCAIIHTLCSSWSKWAASPNHKSSSKNKAKGRDGVVNNNSESSKKPKKECDVVKIVLNTNRTETDPFGIISNAYHIKPLNVFIAFISGHKKSDRKFVVTESLVQLEEEVNEHFDALREEHGARSLETDRHEALKRETAHETNEEDVYEQIDLRTSLDIPGSVFLRGAFHLKEENVYVAELGRLFSKERFFAIGESRIGLERQVNKQFDRWAQEDKDKKTEIEELHRKLDEIEQSLKTL